MATLEPAGGRSALALCTGVLGAAACGLENWANPVAAKEKTAMKAARNFKIDRRETGILVRLVIFILADDATAG
jgi:hypothetical protein